MYITVWYSLKILHNFYQLLLQGHFPCFCGIRKRFHAGSDAGTGRKPPRGLYEIVVKNRLVNMNDLKWPGLLMLPPKTVPLAALVYYGSNRFQHVPFLTSSHFTLLPLANSFPSSNLGIAIQHEVNLHSSLWSADTPADQRAVWLLSGCHWKSGSLQSPKIIVLIRMRRMRMRMRMIAIIIIIISSSSSSSVYISIYYYIIITVLYTILYYFIIIIIVCLLLLLRAPYLSHIRREKSHHPHGTAIWKSHIR